MTDTAPNPLPPRLAAIHSWVHGEGWLRRFTLANRLLLATAFLPSGLVKLLGHRFTLISDDTPIGFFFEAMYRTGAYWHFIGLVQVLAAVLLLIPRTATLGALLFLPIAISVFLITAGMGFGGTVLVTGGMLLAVTYLICWDADRIWAAAAPLLRRRRDGGLLHGMHWLEASGWLLGGLTGIGFLLAARGLLPPGATATLFFIGLGAVGAVGAGWIAAAVRKARDRASR